jgi:hypothetical protein
MTGRIMALWMLQAVGLHLSDGHTRFAAPHAVEVVPGRTGGIRRERRPQLGSIGQDLTDQTFS